MLPLRQGCKFYKLYFISYKNLFRALFTCAASFSVFGVISHYMCILVNISSSLPETYFLHFPNIKAKRGDITIYSYSDGRRLIKRVLGIAGDRIYFDKDKNLWVGDFKVGKCLPGNSYGVSLEPIHPGFIPKDFVFLFAPHFESLDSRYTKIGLVHQSHLLGKAIALW